MGVVDFCRFDILLVSLDSSQGAQIKKTRPCIVISPNEMNKFLKTLIVAPLTSKGRPYLIRIPLTFKEKEGKILLDQIRAIDKSRIVKKLGTLDPKTASLFLETLGKMFS